MTIYDKWQRFIQEDASTLVAMSALCSCGYFAREYLVAPAPHQLRQALVRTRRAAPIVVGAVAVGMVGMKTSVTAVSAVRGDHTRNSILVALPLFAGAVHFMSGPRVMALAATGYGALIFSADYAFRMYHTDRMERELAEEQAMEFEQRVLALSPFEDQK